MVLSVFPHTALSVEVAVLTDSSEGHLGPPPPPTSSFYLENTVLLYWDDNQAVMFFIRESLIWAQRLRWKRASLYKSTYLSLCL